MYINPVCEVSGDAILDYLCKVEEGKFHSLPEGLREIVYNGKFVIGKKAVGIFRTKKSKCAICGFDSVLDWHHIWVIDFEKPLMADGRHYQYCLGLIRLCPNHHAIVSRWNNSKQGNGE